MQLPLTHDDPLPWCPIPELDPSSPRSHHHVIALSSMSKDHDGLQKLEAGAGVRVLALIRVPGLTWVGRVNLLMDKNGKSFRKTPSITASISVVHVQLSNC